MPDDKIVLLEEGTNVQPGSIQEDGSFWMVEKILIRDQKVRIYVHSNEICGHSRPHVHASYDHYEYQISIDDSVEVLQGDGPDKYGLFLKKGYFSPWRIQEYRKAWNEISSNYKFVEKNGVLVPPNQ